MERDFHSWIYCSAGTLVCLTQPICMGLPACLPVTGGFTLFSCQRQFTNGFKSPFLRFLFYDWYTEQEPFTYAFSPKLGSLQTWSFLVRNLLSGLKPIFPPTSYTGHDAGVSSIIFLKECRLQQFSLPTALVTSGAKGQL